ncbi:MAG: zinc ABC transporter substrate-binding protein, partial [SAR324 cluster bacterium]|nr:zinc ABC transporter substrate-binding protein [SAR324 cluster bacterium]
QLGTSLDPHIWLAPSNVQKMGEQILGHLLEIIPNNSEALRSNFLKFSAEVEKLDEEIRGKLAKSGNPKGFLVFHPAWGYFAKEYGLQQFSIELEGKEPSPAELIKELKEVQDMGIQNIWVQPQRSSRMAKTVANSLGGEIIELDPLAANWHDSLRKATNQIVEN